MNILPSCVPIFGRCHDSLQAKLALASQLAAWFSSARLVRKFLFKLSWLFITENSSTEPSQARAGSRLAATLLDSAIKSEPCLLSAPKPEGQRSRNARVRGSEKAKRQNLGAPRRSGCFRRSFGRTHPGSSRLKLQCSLKSLLFAFPEQQAWRLPSCGNRRKRPANYACQELRRLIDEHEPAETR